MKYFEEKILTYCCCFVVVFVDVVVMALLVVSDPIVKTVVNKCFSEAPESYC